MSKTQREAHEARIAELLGMLHDLPAGPSPRRAAIETEILALVSVYLQEVLKPFLLAKYGAVLGEGGAARFTAMMNDFFIKVLEQRADPFWRANSARELSKYVSVAMTRQMIDALRRERRYQDGFDALIDERREFFKAKTGLDLTSEVLGVVEEWCQDTHPEQAFQGWVLRHRFVDGMTREQIAQQLKVTQHAVRLSLDQGIAALRRVFVD